MEAAPARLRGSLGGRSSGGGGSDRRSSGGGGGGGKPPVAPPSAFDTTTTGSKLSSIGASIKSKAAGGISWLQRSGGEDRNVPEDRHSAPEPVRDMPGSVNEDRCSAPPPQRPPLDDDDSMAPRNPRRLLPMRSNRIDILPRLA